jgi:hypothetical protein
MAERESLFSFARRALSTHFVTRRQYEILERNWQELLKINDRLAKAAKGDGPVTPDEMRARGFEGVSNCRCEDYEMAEFVPCPPLMCEAGDLVQELREMSLWHLIAFSLLNDEQMDEYRRRKNLTPDELQEALDG